MNGLNHRQTRSRNSQREERTQHEESKESETETVLLSPIQSNEENLTKTARGRPKSKSKLPAISCRDGRHRKNGRCNCPGTTTCIRCCDKCNDRSPKATNLLLPISCGEGHEKNGRCSCPQSTSCKRCCNVCNNDSSMTALERTPYKERPKRSTKARTESFCFKETDDEGNSENEDEDEKV